MWECLHRRVGAFRFVGCATLSSRKLYSLLLTLQLEVFLGNLLILRRPHELKRPVRADLFFHLLHSLNAADLDILRQCAERILLVPCEQSTGLDHEHCSMYWDGTVR